MRADPGVNHSQSVTEESRLHCTPPSTPPTLSPSGRSVGLLAPAQDGGEERAPAASLALCVDSQTWLCGQTRDS